MPDDLQVFIDELHDQIIHISTREPTAEYTVEEYSDVVVDLLIKLSADGVRGDARKQEKVIATFVDDMGIYLITGSGFEAKTKEEHIKMEIFKDYHKMSPRMRPMKRPDISRHVFVNTTVRHSPHWKCSQSRRISGKWRLWRASRPSSKPCATWRELRP